MLTAPAQTADIWHGDAGWLPIAAVQLHAGEHLVGDVVVEADLARTRTGRIMSEILLTSDAHGSLTISVNTLVVANRLTYAMIGGQEPARVIDAGIEWCTVGEAPQICISRPSNLSRLLAPNAPPRFTYTEYSSPAQRSGRAWAGDEPVIREERVDFEPTIRKQFVIRAIAREGVSLRMRTIRGGQPTDGPALPIISFGTPVHDSGAFSGVAFQFRRAHREQVIVEALEAPPAATDR